MSAHRSLSVSWAERILGRGLFYYMVHVMMILFELLAVFGAAITFDPQTLGVDFALLLINLGVLALWVYFLLRSLRDRTIAQEIMVLADSRTRLM